MEAVPFFSDEIVIKPHTCTDLNHLGVRVSLREFADGSPISLYKLDNGDLLARKRTGEFIEGREAV